MKSHSLWVGKIAPVDSFQTEDDYCWNVCVIKESFENFLTLVAEFFYILHCFLHYLKSQSIIIIVK